MNKLAAWLRDPSIARMDVDGQDRLAVHARMLARKTMLREVFHEFHHRFMALDERFFTARGMRIELGAGVAPIRESYPTVLATDIVASPHLDQVLDAEAMALPDQSVRAIYGQNFFHHLPHPDRFFDELKRVLPAGGGTILLEPYYGPAASYLFKRMFATEGFDKDYPSWETPQTGPMNGANQALSYVVFKRDVAIFERKHPELKIVHHELCGNHIKYLISGGLNFRQLLPDWMRPAVNGLQIALSPLNRWTSLHHIVVIRKV
jgi:SAM-dependent methyltransferase